MATHADIEIILKLYDLRRESVCREARKFFSAWNPQTDHEVQQTLSEWSRQDNAFVRQATSYWEMAFSFANSGALDADLFAKNCGEGILYALKCAHLRAKFPSTFTRTMGEAEAFIAKNAFAKQKAEMFKSRFAN